MTRGPVSGALAGPPEDGLAALDSLLTVGQGALQLREGGCYRAENDSYLTAMQLSIFPSFFKYILT